MDNQFAPIGRRMLLLAWGVLFLLIFAFFYFFKGDNKSRVELHHAKVIIHADAQGHYLIDGFINNHPVHFLVDTGATYVAIPEPLAHELHLSGRYPINMQTAKETVSGSLTRLEKLSFAGFDLYNVSAVIINESNDQVVLLGMNVLSKFHITQSQKKLIIKTTEDDSPSRL